MEKYRGIKFKVARVSGKPPPKELKRVCGLSHRLARLGFAPGSSGNVSMRLKDGFLISATGTELGRLAPREVAHVLRFSFAKKTAYVKGAAGPSSETPMHALIYARFPEINAVIHAHSEIFSKSQKWDVPEMPYGTLKLAKKTVEALASKNFITLKGHGCVSTGESMERALGNLLKNAKRLKGKPK